MRVKMTFAVLAITALALSLPASSTANRTVKVEAGESIQAAIDDAKPGTTIKVEEGTYAESVTIAKDDIELVGEGRKKTHIVPPAGPPGDCPAGICVSDPADPDHTVSDVDISHLSVKGFIFGIFYANTKGGEVTRTILSDYEAYGLFANDSSGIKISRNVTYNSVDGVDPEAGIYVGDSPHADATVWKNVSFGNLFGIFIRDAAHGKLLENKTFSNCVGIVFLNTDETAVPPGTPPGTPVDVKDWLTKDNIVAGNNRECAASDEAPPLSGIGIGILGGNDIDLIDNGVFGNKPAAGFLSAFAGGIIITASDEFTPPRPSSDIKVAFNTAFGNATDLILDPGNEASFFANDCLTSMPDGLCEDVEHSGDHGNGNGHHGDDDDHGDRHHTKHKKHKGGKNSKHKKNKKHFKHHDD
jgi:parallel beta helix pectate lyase-like protein